METSTPTALADFSQSYAKVHGVLATIVCIFGIAANLANVIVLTRKNMISSTNYILTWLAVADLLTMVSCFFFVIHFYLMKEDDLGPFQTRSYAWVNLLCFHASFAIVCHTVATWLTIVLAIFRYIYIWLPTRGSFLCSMTRAKLSIIAVYVLSIVICIPNFIMNTIVGIPANAGNGTVELGKGTLEVGSGTLEVGNGTLQLGNTTSVTSSYAASTVAMTSTTAAMNSATIAMNMTTVATATIWTLGEYNDKTLKDINFWLQAVMLKLVPCIMLTILTILLILAMHVAYKRRMRLRNQNSRQESGNADHNRTTGMLLAIVILFLITELPQGILTLLSFFIAGFYEDYYMNLGDILDILALINNSINFVLYCSMSKQFRDTFSKIFCRCFFKKEQEWSKVTLLTNTNASNGKQSASNTQLNTKL